MADPPCITGASRLSRRGPWFVRWHDRDPFVHAESVAASSSIAADLTVVCLMRKLTQHSNRSNQRDVRVEFVARVGCWDATARRFRNSCRCGSAVESAQRFRSSSGAGAPLGSRRAAARASKQQLGYDRHGAARLSGEGRL